jgi:hypothetical protein
LLDPMRPSRRLPLHLNTLFAAISVAIFVLAAPGQSQEQIPAAWNDALSSLAEKIVADAKPARSISLTMQNMSSLDSHTANRITAALVAELSRRSGWKSQESATTPGSPYLLSENPSVQLPADAQAQVTLSEGTDGYVWVAQVNRGDVEQVEMVSAGRQDSATTGAGKPWLSLRRNLLWAQSRPILDFADEKSGDSRPDTVFVLEPDRVALGTFGGETLTISGSSALSDIPASRDLRGRLELTQKGQATAFVAGTVCTAESPSARFSCGRERGKDWRIGNGLEAVYIANRNYFAGLLAAPPDPAAVGRPFYSAAALTAGSQAAVILTELDGKSRFYGAAAEAAGTLNGWGDDIATISAECDSSPRVLVTGAADWTQPDRIQLYAVSGGTVSDADGQPLEFPGPILALWPADDLKSARVISRNLRTGMYEASTVSVSCGN